MKSSRHHFVFIVVLTFFLTACGLVSDQPDGGTVEDEPTAAELSKEAGFSCMEEGDIACAKENYCGISKDNEAGLRCCFASFLQSIFSDNMTQLGEMLGYNPVGFKELRSMSREEILDQKALPFAELYLIPESEGKIKTTVTQWGTALSGGVVRTQDLKDKLSQLGQDLAGTVSCLNENLSKFESDEFKKEVLAAEENLPVALRDLLFIKALLGVQSYALQVVADYDWGFEQFPSADIPDSFITDINGQAGEGDARFGDLPNGETVADKFPLLVRSFDALKAYSSKKDRATKIDAYLNWRLTKETQEKYSNILVAAYQSLKSGKWQSLPSGDKEINLFSLSSAGSVPNGNRVADEAVVLEKDDAGEWEKNEAFFEEFLKTVLKSR